MAAAEDDSSESRYELQKLSDSLFELIKEYTFVYFAVHDDTPAHILHHLEPYRSVVNRPDNILTAKKEGIYPIATSMHPLVTSVLIDMGADINAPIPSLNTTAFLYLMDRTQRTYGLHSGFHEVIETICEKTTPDLFTVDKHKRNAVFYVYTEDIYRTLITPVFERGNTPMTEQEYLNQYDTKGLSPLSLFISFYFFNQQVRKNLMNQLYHLVELQMKAYGENQWEQHKKEAIEHIVAERKTPYLRADYVRFLCERGADVNGRHEATNQTLFHIALRMLDMPYLRNNRPFVEEIEDVVEFLPDFEQIFEILLEYGADMSLPNKHGETPIDAIRAIRDRLRKSNQAQTSLYYHGVQGIIERLYDRLYHHCAVCKKTGDLKKCAGCEQVFYCSAEHQRKDWPVHKKVCKELARAAAAGVKKKGGRRIAAKHTMKKRGLKKRTIRKRYH